ncbi:hypothetical protein N8I77_009413 [Diaporthe amygdali]|uniref:Uncharacterized protein n=1 Tax=Phomopsis amygdali TaxID=1214568 RepID=A0AAD9W0X1_PHOAM|nr:hypothetical protein N8I77_009413 [Diaporthe amygdali]
MEERSKKRRLLFLHANEGNHTSRRTRSKSLDTKIRRHLMIDIGKSRRKPSKDLQFGTLVWPLARTPKTQPSISRGQDSTSRDDDYSQAPTKDLVAPASYTAPYVMPPILYTLSAFEKEWGEDWFSAYGFTLIMVAGKNAMSSACSTNTFWFPFAFKKSAFLQHYRQIFTSPDVLIPLYRGSAGELRSLALERSLVTIQCVESRLASSNASSATSDSVINAVLALVCYNFTSLDFDQAMIHVKGMWMVVAARGGISTLESNQDLMLMISWVDITAALLHDTKPLFPLSANMASPSVFHRLGWEMLPAPLISVINDENTQDAPFMSVMSCIGDINALATLLRIELAFKARISTLLKIISSNSDAEQVWNSSSDLQTVRLWLLVLCSISEPSDQDHATLMRMIVSDMKEQELASWDETMSNIRRMPWMDIYEPPCVELGQRLVKDYL